MFITIAVVLALVWVIAVILSLTLGGLIHILLVFAIISLIYHFINDTDSKGAPTRDVNMDSGE